MLLSMYSNRNFHSFLVGMQDGIASLEDSLIFNLNIVVPYDSLILLLNIYIPKGDETLCSHRNLNMNIYGSFLINAKTWKQPIRPSAINLKFI